MSSSDELTSSDSGDDDEVNQRCSDIVQQTMVTTVLQSTGRSSREANARTEYSANRIPSTKKYDIKKKYGDKSNVRANMNMSTDLSKIGHNRPKSTLQDTLVDQDVDVDDHPSDILDSEPGDDHPSDISDSEQGDDHPSDISDSEHGDDVEDTEHDEYAAIKKELSTMSFEDIQKLKDKIGVKLYNQIMRRGNSESMGGRSGKKRFRRENKNRPMEMSSKRPVSRYRELQSAKRKVTRDPRFDDLSGEYSESFFKHAYSFLDDVRDKETENLKKQAKKEENPEKKEKIRSLLKTMEQEDTSKKQKEKQKETQKQWKKQEKLLVKQGKQPYFLKKSEQKKLELAEKFKELKKSGKLEKYMSKKRKKNAAKEKRRLPYQQ